MYLRNKTQVSVLSDDCSPSDEVVGILSDATRFVFLVGFLVLLNTTVLAGNSLVISAILTDERLRSVTNTFVASLALADLMLGLTVLPFSSANQVLHYWPFGGTWCNIWLVVDVWLCTSSILNLCAISLDRYLAIRYSFHYPRLMSPIRSKLLVTSVWVAAFLICFPPLIGWRSSTQSFQTPNQTIDNVENSREPQNLILFEEVTTVTTTHHQLERSKEPCENHNLLWTMPSGPQCQLNSDSRYVIYSACGSFWIPMCVMVFFYWRIYVTASRNSQALRRGFVIVQSVDRRRMVGSEGGSDSASTRSDSVALRVHRGGRSNGYDVSNSIRTTTTLSYRATHSLTKGSFVHASSRRRRSVDRDIQTEYNENLEKGRPRHLSRSKSKAAEGTNRTQTTLHQNSASKMSVKCGLNSSLFKIDGFQARSYLHRLNKEKKAAKTIAIIVGCFIACWAPFFTVYLLGAFCDHCTSDHVFTIFFWLGYFNSAINPFIYALCSRDFRTAFKKLLRCRQVYAHHQNGFRKRTWLNLGALDQNVGRSRVLLNNSSQLRSFHRSSTK